MLSKLFPWLSWIGAFLRNVAIFSTIVASFFVSGQVAVIRNVTKLSTVETTSEWSFLGINLFPRISLYACVLAVSCKVATLFSLDEWVVTLVFVGRERWESAEPYVDLLHHNYNKFSRSWLILLFFWEIERWDGFYQRMVHDSLRIEFISPSQRKREKIMMSRENSNFW